MSEAAAAVAIVRLQSSSLIEAMREFG